MIDRKWCKKQITVEEAESMTYLDFLRLDENMTVVDKSDWFHEPMLPKRSDWGSFKARMTANDELWTYENSIYGQSVYGVAIMRDDKVLHEFIVGMR